MGKKRLSEGGLFYFPVGEHSFVGGQIIKAKPFLYICIFENAYSSPPSQSSLADEAEILLVGFVTDAGFHDNSWVVVGRGEIPPAIPYPNYVIDTTIDGSIRAVLKAFDGTLIRPATQDDIELYHRKTIFTAEAFEKASANLLFGIGDSWDYQRLLATYVYARAKAPNEA